MINRIAGHCVIVGDALFLTTNHHQQPLPTMSIYMHKLALLTMNMCHEYKPYNSYMTYVKIIYLKLFYMNHQML